MSRSIDPVAYTQAMRQWVVPECLHVPIAAKDEQALIDHVGDIVRTLSPGRAYLIAVEDPPPRDLRLPIWKMENTEIFHDKFQIWVNPLYTRYRSAYKKGKPDERIDDKVLHHCGNRRIAYLQGYKFIRLISISRRANSSSRFSEQWGVDLNTPDYVERLNAKGFRIKYADQTELMLMLDILLGGGVMEVARIGQNLFEIPGKRPPQK